MYISELIIETAQIEDLQEILNLQKEAYIQEAQIYNDFSIQPLMQTIEEVNEEYKNGTILKATINNKILGSVRGKSNNTICEIGKLIVSPKYQNMGIGKMLLKKIEEEFSNSKKYKLFTAYKSEKNISLYKKMGFCEIYTEKIDDNFSFVHLEKIKQ